VWLCHLAGHPLPEASNSGMAETHPKRDRENGRAGGFMSEEEARSDATRRNGAAQSRGSGAGDGMWVAVEQGPGASTVEKRTSARSRKRSIGRRLAEAIVYLLEGIR
jgi:hypothetical protein